MKTPHDLSGDELISALRALGYEYGLEASSATLFRSQANPRKSPEEGLRPEGHGHIC